MDRLWIKNGTLVSADSISKGDILIEGGKIKAVGTNLSVPANTPSLDASEKIVFPGFIDPHTHLDLQAGAIHTADDFETGSLGAIAGGTTTIIDFATQERGETLEEGLANWHRMADGRTSCDYAFHMAISDWNEDIRKELTVMRDAGITSFKFYMAYPTLRSSDRAIFEAMKAIDALGGISCVHCENGDLVEALTALELSLSHTAPDAHPRSRPDFVEAEAVNRYLTIAEAAKVPAYVVHLSTERGLAACLAARERGQQVHIETCPQYLILDDSCYDVPDFEGAKYVFAPPARKPNDRSALWSALSNGYVDTVGSDHCSFNFVGGKDAGLHDFSKIPNGIPGVETRPILLYTLGVAQNKITLCDMVAQLSENPARIFGMYPQKGALLPESDGDLVIWNPKTKGFIDCKSLHMNVDYSPYQDLPTQGKVETVVLGGKIVVSDGKIVQKNAGQFVPRGRAAAPVHSKECAAD